MIFFFFGLISQDFASVFASGVGLLLTPVTLSTAPTFKTFSQADNRTQTTKQDYCTQPVNLAGLPAVTVPVRLAGQHDLPVSVQLIGPMRKERRLLDVAQVLEDNFRFPYMEFCLLYTSPSPRDS